jgi:predicted HNH restriction endonuclease
LGQLKPGQLTKTTTKDLAPVCANCHRMLHRAGGLSIRELAERVRR